MKICLNDPFNMTVWGGLKLSNLSEIKEMSEFDHRGGGQSFSKMFTVSFYSNIKMHPLYSLIFQYIQKANFFAFFVWTLSYCIVSVIRIKVAQHEKKSKSKLHKNHFKTNFFCSTETFKLSRLNVQAQWQGLCTGKMFMINVQVQFLS